MGSRQRIYTHTDGRPVRTNMGRIIDGGNMEIETAKKWRWKILTGWVIVFSCVVLFSLNQISDLGKANKKRLEEIQLSRTYSCKQTYKTMKSVIAITNSGRELTPLRKKHIAAFKIILDPARCVRQTSPKTQGN